jgi:hypothetical protein
MSRGSDLGQIPSKLTASDNKQDSHKLHRPDRDTGRMLVRHGSDFCLMSQATLGAFRCLAEPHYRSIILAIAAWQLE